MSHSRQFVFLCPYVAQPSRHTERVNEYFDRTRRFFGNIFELAPFRTAESLAIEAPGGAQVVNRDREVKWRRHGATMISLLSR